MEIGSWKVAILGRTIVDYFAAVAVTAAMVCSRLRSNMYQNLGEGYHINFARPGMVYRGFYVT